MSDNEAGPAPPDDVMYATGWNRTKYLLEQGESSQYWPQPRRFFARIGNEAKQGDYKLTDGARGTASAQLTTEESEDGEDLEQFVEVGLLLSGADFGKYNSNNEGNNKKGGPNVIVPHDPAAIRVCAIVTSHIEEQNKYYVCVSPKDGVCSTKVISGNNVFFYPWCLASSYQDNNLSVKANTLAIGKVVRQEVAEIKEVRQRPQLTITDLQAVEGIAISSRKNFANLASIYWASFTQTGDTSFLNNYSDLIKESCPELIETGTTDTNAIIRFFLLKEDYLDDAVTIEFVKQVKAAYPQVGDLNPHIVQRTYRAMKVHNLFGKVSRRLIPTFLKLLQRKNPSNAISKEKFREMVVECVGIIDVVEKTTTPVADLGGDATYRAVLLAHYNEILELRAYLLRCSESMRSAHGPSISTTSINDLIAKAAEAVDVGTLEMYIRQILVLDVSGVCHNIHKAINHLDTMIGALSMLLNIPA